MTLKIAIISKACSNSEYRKKIHYLSSKNKNKKIFLIIPDKYQGQKSIILEKERKNKNLKIIVKKCYFNHSSHLFYFKNLRGLIKKIKPDLIHIDEEPYNPITYLVGKQGKQSEAKILFFSWQNLNKKYPWPFNLIEKKVFRLSAGAIAGGQEAKEVLRKKGFRKKIWTVPQFGVDETHFKPDKKKREKIRKKMGWQKNKFVVGYSGRLVKEKGTFLLIKSIEKIKGARLLIAGEGPEKKKLQERIRRGRLGDKIMFAGQIKAGEMPEFYNSLDCLVLPSLTTKKWKEQFGRVLIEAMSCEVPVIGSTSGEIPKVIGKTGMIFKEGDAADLIEKIKKLQEDKRLRKKLAKKGRKRIEKYFTQKKIAEETVKIYNKILKEKKDSQVLKKFYDRKYFQENCGGAEEWEKSEGRRLEPRLKKAWDLASIKPGEKVLDFGFGRGEIVLHSVLKGAWVVGIDYSPDAMKIAQKRLSYLPEKAKKKKKLSLHNQKNLPWQDNSFDKIFFLDTIEHLYPEEAEEALREFYRILKKGGRLIIHTAPNKLYSKKGSKIVLKIKRIINPYYKFLTNQRLDLTADPNEAVNKIVHVNEQTKKSLKEILTRAGFKSKVWLSDKHEITSLKNLLTHLFIKPIFIPWIKKYFTYNLWAVAEKN